MSKKKMQTGFNFSSTASIFVLLIFCQEEMEKYLQKKISCIQFNCNLAFGAVDWKVIGIFSFFKKKLL